MSERARSTPVDPDTTRILSIGAIVAIYWLVAAAWIVGSDLLLDGLRGDVSDDVAWDIGKGIAFVTVTAALLYGLLRRRQALLDRAREHSDELQDRLADVERMDAVGRLAGGVAHDFNNLLAVARGHVELARLDVPDEQTEHLGAIDQALDRAVTATRELQTVARRQQLALVPTDLSSLVESHRADLAGLMPASVQVEIEADADPGGPPTVVALDPAHFPQVILDLAANARDAMPDGGTLRVAVRRTSDRGVLVVSDTGRGMSDDELRHCFEPFFTTKPTGKGTGLGLALTYGLVHQSGGDIEVRSDPGRGTTFEISLPLAAPTASDG
ncbi:MAG: HAMP domain-containing sensor histidine kinase [Ilumatobacteraceae bacterium]